MDDGTVDDDGAGKGRPAASPSCRTLTGTSSSSSSSTTTSRSDVFGSPPPSSQGGRQKQMEEEEREWWLHRLWDRYCGHLSGGWGGSLSITTGTGASPAASSVSGNTSGRTNVASGNADASSGAFLSVKCPQVNTLWNVWSPFLRQLPLFERQIPSPIITTEAPEEEQDEEGGKETELETMAVGVKRDRDGDEKGRLGNMTRTTATTTIIGARSTSATGEGAGTFSHVFFLPLRSPKSPTPPTSPSSLWTTEMYISLMRQPQLILPLIHFFYAWMLFQGEEGIRVITQSQQQEQQYANTGFSSLMAMDHSQGRGGLLREHDHHQSREAQQKTTTAALDQEQRQRQLRRQRRIACEGRLFCCVVVASTASSSTDASHRNSSSCRIHPSPHFSPSPRTASCLSSLITPFARIGAGQLQQLLVVTGSVIRLSAPRIRCVAMQYTCQLCGAMKWAAAEDGVLVFPGPCEGRPRDQEEKATATAASPRRGFEVPFFAGRNSNKPTAGACRGYKWSPNMQVSRCEEVQLLKLQESISDDLLNPQVDVSGGQESSSSASGMMTGGGGGVNRVLEVEIRRPFLDRVAVGDTVIICGVLHPRRETGGAGGGFTGGKNGNSGGSKNGASGYQLCLHAISILPYLKENDSDDSNAGGRPVSFDTIQMEEEEEQNGAENRAGDKIGEEVGLLLSQQWSHLLQEKNRPLPSRSRSGPHHPLQGGGLSASSLEMSIGLSERAQFFEAARHPRWFARLAASLAPSLFGLTMVKEALVLAIIGGGFATANANPSAAASSIASAAGLRSNIHVLLLGDPGLGKSQLLRAACRLATRSAYVCAHTSSSCGLTLTLTRDPVTGEAAFEAGAVVHGDGGITGIDEIDKGGGEHKALLEVMEQEVVSVAKAGVVFSMPVHTSVFAAGNPSGGSFAASIGGASAATTHVSLAEACRLSPALLSRFDMVICLRDIPGQACGEWPAHLLLPAATSSSSSCFSSTHGGAADPSSWHTSDPSVASEPSRYGTSNLTDHVLGMHRAVPGSTGSVAARRRAVAGGWSATPYRPPTTTTTSVNHSNSRRDNTGIMHHHGAGNDSNHDPSGKYPYDDDPYSPPTHPTNTNLSPLPHSLVQRFLAFARHHCQPRLLPEAAAVLKAHYLEERGKAASMAGGTATSDRLITPRYLQSLIRLSSARAKVELRNEVTESDAAYAVRLMQGCLCTLRPHSAGFGSSVSVSGGSGVLHGLNVAPVEHQAGGAGRGKRKNQREMVIDRLKVVLVQQHERRTEDTGCSHGPPHTLTRRTILDVCEEVGCKDANAMLRQLNEYGILLQTGDKFVLRGV